jgi:hypothetical protein
MKIDFPARVDVVAGAAFPVDKRSALAGSTIVE